MALFLTFAVAAIACLIAFVAGYVAVVILALVAAWWVAVGIARFGRGVADAVGYRRRQRRLRRGLAARVKDAQRYRGPTTVDELRADLVARNAPTVVRYAPGERPCWNPHATGVTTLGLRAGDLTPGDTLGILPRPRSINQRHRVYDASTPPAPQSPMTPAGDSDLWESHP